MQPTPNAPPPSSASGNVDNGSMQFWVREALGLVLAVLITIGTGLLAVPELSGVGRVQDRGVGNHTVPVVPGLHFAS